MNYDKWESWFLNANKRTHEAQMRVYEFEDAGDTGSDALRAWKKDLREWQECQDEAISEYPEYHAHYLKHRGKSTQSRRSAIANGSNSISGDTEEPDKPPTIFQVIFGTTFFLAFTGLLSYATIHKVKFAKVANDLALIVSGHAPFTGIFLIDVVVALFASIFLLSCGAIVVSPIFILVAAVNNVAKLRGR